MSQTATPIRVAQALGITLSSAIGGFVLSISAITVPHLLESPATLLLKQWNQIYDTGKKITPPFSAVAAAAYFYLASSYRDDRAKYIGYLSAGMLSAGVVPYTFALMMPTVQKLKSKAQGTSLVGKDDAEIQVGGETVHQLVDWWGVLNVGRGLLPLAGGVLGAWITLN